MDVMNEISWDKMVKQMFLYAALWHNRLVQGGCRAREVPSTEEWKCAMLFDELN